MKEYALYNSDDGMIVIEVDARQCTFCKTAFIYKSDNLYHLVDKDTGMAIAHSKLLKDLEYAYICKKKQYDSFRTTDAYKIKVERFEKLKLVANYGKGQK